MSTSRNFFSLYNNKTINTQSESLEKFSLFHLKVLNDYLLDTLETTDLDFETRKWYELNYKRIYNLLKDDSSWVCNKQYLFKKVCYT